MTYIRMNSFKKIIITIVKTPIINYASYRVINADGEDIPGFYAAGEVIGGIHAGNRLGGNAFLML